ncbi:hypothetical protein CRUP_020475 [Coryphaenoides rupestris]|nr:hypothetical protein CRUP_020475 [Coryphaenoides rupestris]
MLEYHIPGSSLLGFFNEGITPPLPNEISNRVPAWVGKLLVSGELSASILLQNRKILYTQVEDSTLESSSLTSRPIRQVLYGLLLGQEVTEWVRDGLELTSTMVQPLVPEDLSLESLPQVGLTTHLAR